MFLTEPGLSSDFVTEGFDAPEKGSFESNHAITLEYSKDSVKTTIDLADADSLSKLDFGTCQGWSHALANTIEDLVLKVTHADYPFRFKEVTAECVYAKCDNF